MVTEGIVIQLITTSGLIIIAWLGNRKLNKIGSDAREAREQTANSHQDAEFPNLREVLTAVHADVRAVSGIVKAHERHLDHIGRNLQDLHRDDTHIENTVDRQAVHATRALAAAVEERNALLSDLRSEIPVIVKTQITQHVSDCPLRDQPKP